jgi:hypothetical protein
MKHTLIAMAMVSLITMVTGCASQNSRRSSSCTSGNCSVGAADCASCNGASCDKTCDKSCDNADDPGSCKSCRGLCSGLCRRGDRVPRNAEEAYNPGPASGAVTYPYYTNRGPRDFLARELPSIGP